MMLGDEILNGFLTANRADANDADSGRKAPINADDRMLSAGRTDRVLRAEDDLALFD
jgi:hypothetical protein